MKKATLIYPLLILFGLIILFGCKKEEDAIPYEGTWELKYGVSGMTGVRTDYSSGNGNFIDLSGGKYKKFSNHKLINTGTFTILEETSILTKQQGNRIIYDNNPDQVRTFIELNDQNSLRLYADAFDGPSSVYGKTSSIN